MKCKVRRLLVLFFVVAISMVWCTGLTYAETTVNHDGFTDIDSQKVIRYAEQWLNNNYGEFYNIRNVKVQLVGMNNSFETIDYIVSLSCETNYKIDKVEDIPLISGVMDYSKEHSLTISEKAAIDEFIDAMANDAFAEDWVGLNVDVVIRVSTVEEYIPWSMLYDDGLTGQFRDIKELALNYDELYALGYKTAEEIIQSSAPESQGTDTYNKTLARNYSRQYSSNPTTCDVHGSTCGYFQNRSYWNSSMYPNYSGLIHNDCADFVSQALSKGGIPETSGSSGWYRTKYATGYVWSSNWSYIGSPTSSGNLAYYMINHSYFTSATYANCLAGEVITTNGDGHVVMVDYNDGTTHRFNGHTNDRCQYCFSSSVVTHAYHVHRWEYPTN